MIFILDNDGEKWIKYIEKIGFEAICEPLSNLPTMKACILDLRDGAKKFAAKWQHQLGFMASFDDVSRAPEECNVKIGPPFPTTSPYTETTRLTGTEYVLVDSKYYQIGPKKVGECIEKLTISFGLHDTANATSKVLIAIKKLGASTLFRPKSIVVYLGNEAPHIENVRSHVQALGHHATLIVDSNDIIAGLKNCDLAIGGGGVGMFERASAGVPSLTFSIADNQIENACGAHSARITMYGGDIRNLAPGELESTILKIVGDQHLRQELNVFGPRLIDGKGALRLATALRDLAKHNSMEHPSI